MELCINCMAGSIVNGVCNHCHKPAGSMDGRVPYALPVRMTLYRQYYIGRVLGAGGYGITYLAWDLRNNRRVAVKELYPRENVKRNPDRVSVTANPGSEAYFQHVKESFKREAQVLHTLADLKDVIEVYHLFELNNTVYYVMEYLEGEDLKHRLKRSGTMTWEELAPHIWRVLCALNALHSNDLIHRDISPDNIFLLSDGGTKLIDFGSVRNYADGSEKSTILKRQFAPFEQYQRRGKQGPWTDIYALSVTMYYALTAQLPASAPDRMDDDRTPPLQQIAPNVPRHVAEAIFKGMSPMIENRFPTVKAFAAALFPGKRLESTARRVEQPTHSAERGGARLFCTQGMLKGGSITLYPGQIVSIGRAPECTISYAQFNPKQLPGVSRRQCSISMNEQGQLFAQDNGSSYGTLVNQRPLPQGQWVPIARGSVIQFGYQLFCIQ